jgi:outer membrane receptor protein involved in Fe transport
MNPRLCALLCGASVLVTSGAAHAQAQLEEVVVTARKREETLQSVPVAVSVISEAQIKNNLANDLTKVGELAPQVVMSQGGSGTGAIIAVRGVASSSSDAGLDQSVALEMDDVPLSRGRIMSATLFDISNVQVLQGPQALFFGKNSPAGVISIRSRDPGNEFDGYVTAGYEFEAHERYVEGAVGGPLSDAFKARFAFRADKMRGWIRNVAQPIPDLIRPTITIPGNAHGNWLPATRNIAGRLSLLWQPDETFDARFKATYSLQKRNSALSNNEPFCINGQTVPVQNGTLPSPGSDCEKNQVTSNGAVPAEYARGIPYSNGGVPYFRSDFSLISLTLEKRFDHITVTSTTGSYNQMLKQLGTTFGPYALLWSTQKESFRLLTQEVRMNTDFDGPVNAMLGVYYEHSNRPFMGSPELFHSFNPVAGNYASVIMQSKNREDYLSAFGQLRWNILPNLELAGGARWIRDKKRTSVQDLAVNPTQTGALPVGVVVTGRFKDTNISPEVTLTWHPQEDQTLYGAFKTGYKAGGLSNTFIPPRTTTQATMLFRPEKAKGFEGGYKATVLDRRMRFDLVAYRYIYKDLQVVAFVPPSTYRLQNAASSKIQGVQGSAEWAATDDLTLRGNFGYNKARYRRFTTSQCYQGQNAATGCVGGVQDLSGKPLFNAPKFSMMVGGDYRVPVVSGFKTVISASASRTSSYNAATDFSPGGHQKGYWLVNAAIRVAPENDRFELALIGRNLTNSYYFANVVGWSGSGSNNQYVGFFNRPREVALQATARF